MRQEAGNLSSGAISPFFDLGRLHTRTQRKRAEQTLHGGEAPSREAAPAPLPGLQAGGRWGSVCCCLALSPFTYQGLCTSTVLPQPLCHHCSLQGVGDVLLPCSGVSLLTRGLAGEQGLLLLLLPHPSRAGGQWPGGVGAVLAQLPGHLWPFGSGKGQHVLAGVAQPWGPQGELSSDSVLGTWLLRGCPGLPIPHPYPIGGVEALGCPQGWGRDPSPAAAATSQPYTHTCCAAGSAWGWCSSARPHLHPHGLRMLRVSTFLLPGLGKGRSCFVLVEELEMVTVPWG